MKRQPVVKYGDTINVLHHATKRFLKSMAKNYTHRGSSNQQMVVGARIRSADTFWIVKSRHSLGASSPSTPVKHGDIVRLEHVSTKRNLHSHGDRPSPITKQQEVTCYGEQGIGDANDDWKLDLPAGEFWEEGTPFRLVHVSTGKVLHSHGHEDTQLTAGEQEITCFPMGDVNDLWSVAGNDAQEYQEHQVSANKDVSPASRTSLREWAEKHPLPVFLAVILATGGITWKVCDQVLIRPLHERVDAKDDTIRELRTKLSDAQRELDGLKKPSTIGLPVDNDTSEYLNRKLPIYEPQVITNSFDDIVSLREKFKVRLLTETESSSRLGSVPQGTFSTCQPIHLRCLMRILRRSRIAPEFKSRAKFQQCSSRYSI